MREIKNMRILKKRKKKKKEKGERERLRRWRGMKGEEDYALPRVLWKKGASWAKDEAL